MSQESSSGDGDRPAASDPERILIVLPNWVGDLVLATPALQALRSRFPNARITGLLKNHLAEVLSGSEWIDEFVFWPLGASKPSRRQGFLGLAGELRDQRFDVAMLFTNSFRSALIARLAGIKRRVGYDREGRGLLLTDKLLPHKFDGRYVPTPMIRYYNAMARYLGCRECPEQPELFTTEEQERVAAAAIEAAGVAGDRPIVVINPGASYGPAKCWLPERFAEVADRLVSLCRAAVFVACAPAEIDVARQVASRMRERATVLDDPVMRLGPLKAFVRRASLLVTNDTGPRHFANAFGTPVVTLFGPTDPEWTRTDAPGERSLLVPVDCGPCMKRVCPLDHRCMTRIASEKVFEVARSLLEGRVSAVAP
ncbi:MAG TPA: lipopolysaccharide heptosyltransferase II [Phycisphaerae bacterium]|nr:lipopolysaccharide heptosyltransferase II [Phycisphaerae bacterium]